jgi:hypothetical protein
MRVMICAGLTLAFASFTPGCSSSSGPNGPSPAAVEASKLTPSGGDSDEDVAKLRDDIRARRREGQ